MKVLAGDKSAAANLRPFVLESKQAIYTTTSTIPDETPMVIVGKKTNPSPGQIIAYNPYNLRNTTNQLLAYCR